MNPTSPIVKHLVLVGGGHSHLAVLKSLGMNPVPGLAVTLISKDIVTPYSGSMPAFIAGHYDFDDMHIDLRPLAQFANVQLIQAEISGIDLVSKRLDVPGRPAISFDAISLNIGSTPNADAIKGAPENAIAVKPIGHFLHQWSRVFETALAAIKAETPFNLVLVGGGPASVELAFATQYRLATAAGLATTAKSSLCIKLVTNSPSVLSGQNTKAQNLITTELALRHIEVVPNTKVIEFTPNSVVCDNGKNIEADSAIYATGASIPQWPIQCGLTQSSDGFIEVNAHLQSTSHPFVFVAGDAATVKDHPRPKSGVYAVRQGKPLAKNLRRFLTGKALVSYRPQHQALALINLGDKSAMAVRGKWCLSGKPIWALKHRIDSKFVAKYSILPKMEQALNIEPGLVDKAAELELKAHAMRCAGCGAKVAGSILEEVLATLPIASKPDVDISASRVEDASIINLGDNRRLLQSIDQIRAFTNDTWLFAKIATNHCLSDIYAMGVEPHSALAVIGLPHASKAHMRRQLKDVMQGCAETLIENECALIGGHSSESSELQFGLCVNGFTSASVLGKSGMAVGDRLILSKPLGTGTLLAADMRFKARHQWIKAAFASMLISNRKASQILVNHHANACTDITGFGLAGHLLEMMEASAAEVDIQLDSLPLLAGALASLQAGIFSSLHQENASVATSMKLTKIQSNSPLLQTLFDPQTSGGLLASIPQDQADRCLAALLDSGHGQARIIGTVTGLSAQKPSIRVI
jgi:selenide,water dikinase